jgi:type IV secretion system protein VirB6
MSAQAVACPAFADTAPGAGGFGVAHALGSVDCHVGLVVQSGYGQLFGQHGAFGTVLTALLTLYVGFIAIALMTGRTRLTLTGLAPKGLAIGLVLTFATSWPAYHATVYGLLVGGPEEIANALSGGHGGALGFAARLDALLDRFAEVAKAMGDTAPGASKALGPLAGPQMAAALVWLSAMLILIGSAGALVLTRIVLAFLLAMGPVFIVLGLFRQTRGLLEGWLRTTLMFALAPTLTVLAGSAAVALMAPLLDAIADDPASAITELRPILELFLGAIVYVGLIGMMMWTSASLVRGWRFGIGGDAHPQAPEPASQLAFSQPLAGAGGGSAAPASAAAAADPRVGQVMVSLTRDGGGDAAPVSVRVEQAAAPRIEPLAGESAAPSRQRRTEGLGQGLRPAARLPRQAGAIR